MKIAVFHNFIDNIGGAEIVCLTLARELNADVYTTNIDEEKIRRMGFGDVLPRIFSIGKVPVNPPWRQQLALWRFRRLDLKGRYDFFIIGGDWSVSGAVNNKPNLWYVHSPIREIWDLNEYVRENIITFEKRPFFDLWVCWNRWLNRKYLKEIERIVCNSENTRSRVQKYLDREAAVVHPPVEISKFWFGPSRGYWLSVNRLIEHKRIGLQLDAFAELPEERLVIVGSYEQAEHFRRYTQRCFREQPPNVEIRSWISSEELVRLYAECKGFITTSHDEDFGMSAVEALAAGKPVIAPNEGGYKETVVSGKTGALIDDISAHKLKAAVLKLGGELNADPERYRTACQERARQFDTVAFIEKIRDVIAGGSSPLREKKISGPVFA